MLGLWPTERMEFEVGEVVLGRGDTLIIATDGVTDAEDANGEEFGVEGLARASLAACVSAVTAQDFITAVLGDVSEFSKGASEQGDDMTLACLRIL